MGPNHKIVRRERVMVGKGLTLARKKRRVCEKNGVERMSSTQKEDRLQEKGRQAKIFSLKKEEESMSS